MKYTVCGSFENPNRAKNYARFSSKLDYATEDEAVEELERWTAEARYPHIWIQETKGGK